MIFVNVPSPSPSLVVLTAHYVFFPKPRLSGRGFHTTFRQWLGIIVAGPCDCSMHLGYTVHKHMHTQTSLISIDDEPHHFWASLHPFALATTIPRNHLPKEIAWNIRTRTNAQSHYPVVCYLFSVTQLLLTLSCIFICISCQYFSKKDTIYNIYGVWWCLRVLSRDVNSIVSV